MPGGVYRVERPDPGRTLFAAGHAISVLQGLCQERCAEHFGPLALLSSGIGVSLTRMHRKKHDQILRTRWVLMLPTWPLNCWESIWPSGLCHGSPRQSPLCPSACLPKVAATIQRLLAARGTCRLPMISLLWCLPLPTVLSLQLTHLLPTCVATKLALSGLGPSMLQVLLLDLCLSGSADGAKSKAGSCWLPNPLGLA